MNIFSLEGKNAMVTGGAGGIGKEIAIGLAQSGAKVSIASRNLAKLQEAATDIEQLTGSKVDVFVVDIDDEESVKSLVAESTKKLGHVDILINATGFATKAMALEVEMELWDSMFRTNVRGVLLCSREFAKHMITLGGGKIVSLSSVRAFIANAGGNTTYCATKGAINMITKGLATEFGQYKINVNAIAPSLVVTECTREFVIQRSAATIAKTPLGRLGEAKDMAGAAVFLASPAADFVTGQILCIDGGLTAQG